MFELVAAIINQFLYTLYDAKYGVVAFISKYTFTTPEKGTINVFFKTCVVDVVVLSVSADILAVVDVIDVFL